MHRSFGEEDHIFGDLDGPFVGAGQQLPGTLEARALMECAQRQDGLATANTNGLNPNSFAQ
jgi:hypothetical protein